MFTLWAGPTLIHGEDGLTWTMTEAVVLFPVLTVIVWAALTLPLGTLVKESGVFTLVTLAGVTVSCGCASSVSQQPRTATAARVANIRRLR